MKESFEQDKIVTYIMKSIERRSSLKNRIEEDLDFDDRNCKDIILKQKNRNKNKQEL